MLKKFLNYIRLTPKSFIVTLVILISFDFIVRFYWLHLFNQPGKMRLVNQEIESIARLKSELHKASGYKIVFLGDSQTYGSSVKTGDQTIPAILEQELNRLEPRRQVKVFNFAFKGYGISENYFLANFLLNEDIDMVVYNISTSWFNRTDVLEHSNVATLPGLKEKPQITRLGINLGQIDFRKKLEFIINASVGKVWSLYQNRTAISIMLLGKPLREKLTEIQLIITDPTEAKKRELEEQRLYQPWYQKDWNKILGKVDYKFGYINLAPQNPQVEFYKMILKELEHRKVHGIFYSSPQNLAMLQEYYNMDNTAFRKGLVTLDKMTESKYVTYLDYTNLVPEKYFSDSIHMNAHGHQLVASQLAKDIVNSWR
ncbi:MAG: hypothetical protein RO469_05680 [Thermincola sp.]|nr:hypothetical protein [Thermincola sp.]MDT3701716.1 hypothetical protein [Thermincola sp.]